MRTTFNRFNLLNVSILLFSFILMSCQKEGMEWKPLEPSEDPIYLTSEAQTKDTWIKNLNLIAPENPKTDIVESNGLQSATENPWKKIHNDWITIDEGGTLPKEVIRIMVKENTSPHSRSYVLVIYSQTQKSKIAIIQAGKIDN